MRTNLLERLKPKFKVGLEANRQKYPSSVEDIEKILKSFVIYDDLTINQIVKIFEFCNHQSIGRTSFDWKFGQDAFETYNGLC